MLRVLNFCREWLSSNTWFVEFFLFFNCVCYDLRFRVVFSVVVLRGDVLREFPFLSLAGCLVGNGRFVWREAVSMWNNKHSTVWHCSVPQRGGLVSNPSLVEGSRCENGVMIFGSISLASGGILALSAPTAGGKSPGTWMPRVEEHCGLCCLLVLFGISILALFPVTGQG